MSNKKDKQPNPYSVDRLAMIPAPVKAVFIKWWFAGATFFFIGMGIPALHSSDNFDLALVVGIVLGIVNDILVNNVFRYMRTDKNDYDPYMVFPSKKLPFFFCNIIYYILVTAIVYLMYSGINILALNMGWVHSENGIFLLVEPVGFGIMVLIVDFAVLGIKALIRNMISKKAE